MSPVQWVPGIEITSIDSSNEERRRLRVSMLASLLCHLMLVVGLWLGPPLPPPIALPPAIEVELMASLPDARAPLPRARPPAPAARPRPKLEVLPKRPAAAVPRHKKKARPEPKPEPVIRRPERPEELRYEDALARLRGELGESAPEPHPLPAPKVESPRPGAQAPGVGTRISPELAAWMLATRRHIRAHWITPPEFREGDLRTQLRVQVAADGRVIGEPEVVGSSGNPFFDDNAVRAIRRSSPLPPPPRAGSWPIVFTPEERG